MSSLKLKTPSGGSVSFNATDTASDVTLTVPASNASVLTNAEAISSSLLPSGSIKQVVSAITTAVTVNTSTPTPIVSLNITTTGNSKLYCAFSSDLNSDTAGAWKWNGLQVDGTWITRNISSTADAGFQSCISLVGLSTTLSAGSHTVLVAGWNGTGTSTYSEANSEGNSLVVMEVAA